MFGKSKKEREKDMKKEEQKTEVTAKTITTQLQEIEEKNAKAELAEDKRLYSRFKKQIDKAYASMEKSYLDTALALHSIYSKQFYKLDGFANIYDFAQETYGIKKTTCNSFINICEKFGLPNENGTMIKLQDSFADYKSSQLMVMVAFPQELLNRCEKSMTVRQLKDMFKEYKESLKALEVDDSVIDVTENSAEVSDIMSEPEPLDIDKDCKDVFVAKANDFADLLKIQEVIEEALEDIRKGNGKKNAKLEIRIVF